MFPFELFRNQWNILNNGSGKKKRKTSFNNQKNLPKYHSGLFLTMPD